MEEVFLFLVAVFVIIEAILQWSKNSTFRGDLRRLDQRQADLERQLQQIRKETSVAAAPAPAPHREAPREESARVAPPAVAIPPSQPKVTSSNEPAREEPLPTLLVPAHEAARQVVEPSAPRVSPSSHVAPAQTPTPSPQAPEAPTPPSVSPPATPESLFDTMSKVDWESIVGVRLFSWIAGIALLIGAVTFLKYSFDRGWFGPPVQMVVGLVVGVGLLVVCETQRAQRYSVTAHALTAAGIAVLFVTLYAAHARWRIIESGIATFVLMALVTAVAVLLSVRRNSIFIAILGLLGGFLTPYILSTGEDKTVGLFSYLLLLNVGLVIVAYKKRWPILGALALLFTSVYQVGWVSEFFNAKRMPIAMAIFALFPLVGFGALLLSRRKGKAADEPTLFSKTASLAVIPPVVFALYLAITPECGTQYGLFFGFLFLIALGLAAVAAYIGPEKLHLAGAGTVFLAMAAYLGRSYNSSAWPALLPFVALFMALYLVAPLAAKRLGHPFGAEGKLATYAAPLLLFVFPVLAVIEPATKGPLLFFGALVVLVGALAAYATKFEDGPIHFLASAFVLAAEAIWSAKHLDSDRLIAALLVYGGFGLFYLGVPILAERRGKSLKPKGSGAILLFASLGLLFFLAVGPATKGSLLVMALLMAILNVGLLYEASRGRHPILALIGIGLSWVIMAVWWASASLVDFLVPALAVMVGFALLAMGGTIWARRHAEESGEGSAAQTGNGVFLGLAGHLFLFVVAADRGLSESIWPVLAVLCVLDLAIGVAALAVKKGALLLSAQAASYVVLLALVASRADTQTLVAIPIGAALVLALFGLGWVWLAERRGAPAKLFAISAGIGLFLAQLVVSFAAALLDPPRPGHQLVLTIGVSASYVVLLLGILALAWHTRQHAWTLGAVISLAAVTSHWQIMRADSWGMLLGVAVPIYLLFLVNPIALRNRARNDRLPYVAALVASGIFFWFGRWAYLDWFAHSALVEAGAKGAIGLLPVIQAFLLVPHVWMLVRMEPVSERDMGRLAMMAGGVLAFVSVAIPLQLEKQWITLGWALLGMALAWLYRRIPHKGLLVWLAVLLAVVFVRLTLNPSVFAYHEPAATRILNWYLYTWLVAAACFFGAARLLWSTDDRLLARLPRLSQLLAAGGAVLLFWVLNIEIADFFSSGEHLTFSLRGGLAQNLTYTIGWGLFAIGLLVAGVVGHSRAARIASIVLLSGTVLKAFLYDLSGLKDLYRAASFVGLAVCLVLVAVVLQRFVLKRDDKGN